ncbi:MAG TPA: dihydropteroate synthase [Candidatus Avacidaminococcus intestinavium]|uniref:Dihydropteroate synthase n=1 Tax=Candidatus Avacidaminococcus intestinavium TaxID=2840684 RepID=A0A9D1MQ13_9FIRM|nr:dihydropteroate synthase [Candidatus Avacidaminococcus intestinavium]
MIRRINRASLGAELKKIGIHPASYPIFMNKSEIIPFKLLGVRTPAANIIKQEILAAGGDCAVHAGCINCGLEYTDLLLLGTRKHYNILLAKLKIMNYFGLAKIYKELQEFLTGQEVQTVLADGRCLKYEQLAIMGILNITPDSFYAQSRIENVKDAVRNVSKMLEDGASIIDIGGESTRPGSNQVTTDEEISRVVPIIQAIKKEWPKSIISIDTYHARTAEQAIKAGADIINDVTGMTYDDDMAKIAIHYDVPVVLMHMRGTPQNMQQLTTYNNVIEDVCSYLSKQVELLAAKGLEKNKIILDPGIGFAKNAKQNLALMGRLEELVSLGYPVLLAASRKSTIGSVLGDIPAEERLYGTLATSCQAVYAGAHLIRVHDVKANADAVRMLEAILKCQ